MSVQWNASLPLPDLTKLKDWEGRIIRERWNGNPRIPVPESYRLESEAAAFFQKADCPKSPYFTAQDYYHMHRQGSLSLLPCFRTYQQTRPYTCGSAVALMVLWHYGFYDWMELQIADRLAAFHGLPPETRRPIPTSDLVNFFSELGWSVESNLKWACNARQCGGLPPWRLEKNCLSFPELEDFGRFCRRTLDAGDPIMVENMDWGGHWRAIIGYDDMGTPDNFEDDVLILADPHDTGDHCQDGYVVEHMDKFYHTWYDVFIMPPEEKTQPWAVARPPKKKTVPAAGRR